MYNYYIRWKQKFGKQKCAYWAIKTLEKAQ
jgi:hypothetical protein